MPSTGVLYPTAAYQEATTEVDWVDPNNALVADVTSVASVTLTQFLNAERMYLTGYGFSIPVGKQIDGIEMTVAGDYSGSGANLEFSVAMHVNETTKSAFKSLLGVLSSSYSSQVIGGPSDKWSSTLTRTDVNDTNFGAVFSVATGPVSTITVQLDAVGINVYYSDTPPEKQSFFASRRVTVSA